MRDGRDRLGEHEAAERLVDALESYAYELVRTPAKVDYFATSLPALLLFTEDAEGRQREHSGLLLAQVAMARREPVEARRRLDQVLATNPNHPTAVDLRRALASDRDA